MGLNKGLGTREYLTIREGKIAKNLGDKKYELYDSFDGYIVGMSTRTGLYGTDLCLDILDDGKVYQLQLKMKGEEPTSKQSSYFIAFAHCSPSIDLSKRVEFIPSLKVIDDKKRSALFIKQDGQTLKWAFKVGQDGVPAPEELTNKKGEVISVDWSEVEAYRVDAVNTFSKRITPYQPNVNNEEKIEDFSIGSFGQDEDDLPF